MLTLRWTFASEPTGRPTTFPFPGQLRIIIGIFWQLQTPADYTQEAMSDTECIIHILSVAVFASQKLKRNRSRWHGHKQD